VECTSSSPGGAAGSDCVEYEYTVAVALSSGCGTLKTHSGQVNASDVIHVHGIRSGENSLTIYAVDSVGLKQLVPSSFSWTVQLTSDIMDVTIVSGPASICAWKVATFQFFAHRNGTVSTDAQFQVKLDEAVWSEGSVLCNGNICSYSTPVLPLSPHKVQIRAKDAVNGVAGVPALWRWTVAECSETQYANVTDRGSLACEPCPTGGDCKDKDATAHTLVAKPGWWVPPQGPRLTLYRCPLAKSCTGGNESVCDESLGFANSTVCGLCQEKYVRRGDGCTECPSTGQVKCRALFL
jgi:hypothetical protein